MEKVKAVTLRPMFMALMIALRCGHSGVFVIVCLQKHGTVECLFCFITLSVLGS